MTRYRTYTIEFRRQVAEEHLSQGTSLNQLARRHDVSRELLRIWVRKHEAGELASNGPGKADRRGSAAKIAGPGRKGGQATMRSGEHTPALQTPQKLVWRLLPEKKKTN